MTRFLILTSLFALFFSCNKAPDLHVVEASLTKPSEMKKEVALIHTVFFWTKEGTTESQMNDFEKGLEKLGTCPQPISYYWGKPAATEARDVVDQSYDYAINVHFASLEDQDAYQTEPIHLEFIENHKDIWEKVIVYDNEAN